MGIFDVLRSSRGLQLLTQYPDKRLLKGALALNEDERPNVPVRMIDPDPKKNYIFKVRPNTNAIADKTTKQIYVANRPESKDNNSEWLSGVIGHEAEHFKRGDDEEGPAYDKQLEILDRLGYKGRNRKGVEEARLKYEH